MSEWVLYLHPIIRLDHEPIPELARGSQAECETAYFDALDNPEIDDFYLELTEIGAEPIGPVA